MTWAEMSADDRRTLKGVVITVLVGHLITPFLQTGLTVLLPSMGREFAASGAELGLVSAFYCLALAIFHLGMGRAGDKWGRRRICLFGLCFLLITIWAITVCDTIEGVIGLRFLQGMGTAAFNTCSLAMLIACSVASIRGRLLGITSTGVYVGVAIGPVVGGYIDTYLGWRFFFVFLGIITIFALIVALCTVRREWHIHKEAPYDWMGLVLFSLGMFALVASTAIPISMLFTPLLVALGLILFACFLRYEYKLTRTIPLLDVRVLGRNRVFILSNLASLTIYSSLFALSFFFSLYLQFSKGMPASQAGLVLFIQPLAQVLITAFGGWLSDRIGPMPVAFTGTLFVAVSMLFGLYLESTTSMYYIYMLLVLNGLGIGLFSAPNTVLIMGAVDPAHLSQASGLVGTVRTMGMLISMLIATWLVRLHMGDEPMGVAKLAELEAAMHQAFFVYMILCTLSLLCSTFRFKAAKQA